MNIVLRIADRQYFKRTSKSRCFVTFILISATNYDNREFFVAPIKKGLWEKRFELIQRFFEANSSEIFESDTLSRFVQSVFEIISEDVRDRSEVEDLDSDEMNAL